MTTATETKKSLNEVLRIFAGCMTLLGLAIGYFWSPYGYLFVLFVGLNLLQSGFTKWCPAIWFLRKIGLRE